MTEKIDIEKAKEEFFEKKTLQSETFDEEMESIISDIFMNDDNNDPTKPMIIQTSQFDKIKNGLFGTPFTPVKYMAMNNSQNIVNVDESAFDSQNWDKLQFKLKVGALKHKLPQVQKDLEWEHRLGVLMKDYFQPESQIVYRRFTDQTNKIYDKTVTEMKMLRMAEEDKLVQKLVEETMKRMKAKNKLKIKEIKAKAKRILDEKERKSFHTEYPTYLCHIMRFWKTGFFRQPAIVDDQEWEKKESGVLKPFYKKQRSNDRTLIFESRFESGNLFLAFKQSIIYYDLLLENDVNTDGHNQWFYFKVSNTTKNLEVLFKIHNFVHNNRKINLLYKKGMKICIRSKSDPAWHYGGTEIKYEQNLFWQNNKKEKRFYTLSFKYKFLEDNDVVYFAYSYPYTYTNLQNYLTSIQKKEGSEKILKVTKLCDTLAGHKCDLLTITNYGDDQGKKVIFLTARVHPGESVSSYNIHGVINFLLDEKDYHAEILRRNFIFKIVPMLNPDGVINGNFRCSLSGKDLNRCWQNPTAHREPTIYYTKKAIIKEKERIAVFCDFHAHSTKQNSFMYGCVTEFLKFESKELPYILSNICFDFKYKDCNFSMQTSKQSTARIQLFIALKNPNVYNLQTSIYKTEERKQYSIKKLQNIGRLFCHAVALKYVDSPQMMIVKQNKIFFLKHFKKQKTKEFEKAAKKQVKILHDKVEEKLKREKYQKFIEDVQEQIDLIDRLALEKPHYMQGFKEAKHPPNDEFFIGSDSCPEDNTIEQEILDLLLPGQKDHTPNYKKLSIDDKFLKKLKAKRLKRTKRKKKKASTINTGSPDGKRKSSNSPMRTGRSDKASKSMVLSKLMRFRSTSNNYQDPSKPQFISLKNFKNNFYKKIKTMMIQREAKSQQAKLAKHGKNKDGTTKADVSKFDAIKNHFSNIKINKMEQLLQGHVINYLKSLQKKNNSMGLDLKEFIRSNIQGVPNKKSKILMSSFQKFVRKNVSSNSKQKRMQEQTVWLEMLIDRIIDHAREYFDKDQEQKDVNTLFEPIINMFKEQQKIPKKFQKKIKDFLIRSQYDYIQKDEFLKALEDFLKKCLPEIMAWKRDQITEEQFQKCQKSFFNDKYMEGIQNFTQNQFHGLRALQGKLTEFVANQLRLTRGKDIELILEEFFNLKENQTKICQELKQYLTLQFQGFNSQKNKDEMENFKQMFDDALQKSYQQKKDNWIKKQEEEAYEKHKKEQERLLEQRKKRVVVCSKQVWQTEDRNIKTSMQVVSDTREQSSMTHIEHLDYILGKSVEFNSFQKPARHTMFNSRSSSKNMFNSRSSSKTSYSQNKKFAQTQQIIKPYVIRQERLKTKTRNTQIMFGQGSEGKVGDFYSRKNHHANSMASMGYKSDYQRSYQSRNTDSFSGVKINPFDGMKKIGLETGGLNRIGETDMEQQIENFEISTIKADQNEQKHLPKIKHFKFQQPVIETSPSFIDNAQQINPKKYMPLKKFTQRSISVSKKRIYSIKFKPKQLDTNNQLSYLKNYEFLNRQPESLQNNLPKITKSAYNSMEKLKVPTRGRFLNDYAKEKGLRSFSDYRQIQQTILFNLDDYDRRGIQYDFEMD